MAVKRYGGVNEINIDIPQTPRQISLTYAIVQIKYCAFCRNVNIKALFDNNTNKKGSWFTTGNN